MINERKIAADVLMKITEDGSYNNLALKKALNENAGLTRAQKGFITETVNGTLRNLIYIDYIINNYSSVKTTEMKPAVLAVLRTAAHQIYFGDKIPVSAACDEAVKLIKKRGMGSLAGFVNAVLRNITRGKGSLPAPGLAVKYSFPEWITDYWSEFLPRDTVERICAASNERPDVAVCVNTLKTDADTLAGLLVNEGSSVAKNARPGGALHVSGLSFTAGTAFDNGLYHIMDESSMKAVELLGPKPGSFVLDICAGPGGKSFYAAAMMKNTGRILACDIYGHKLKLIEASARRLGITNIEIAPINAETGDYPEADYLLADVPCSGLGLLRKKPDIKYRRSPDDILKLAEIQKKILANASRHVKMNGTLLYSTCTVSKKENEDVAEWFADNFKYRLEERVSILPEAGGGDGFFMAKFIRA